MAPILDYSLQDPKERSNLVQKIIDKTPPEKLTPQFLEILADYIIFAMDKQERRERNILTDNRMITVNKRETSYQGLVAKLENGEDGIYNLVSDLGKTVLFTPKNEITEKDIAEVPGLKELRDSIAAIEEEEKKARGKRKYLLKKQLIEMRQDQYILKNEYRAPIRVMNVMRSFNQIDLDEKVTVKEDGTVESNGIISFFNPRHISALLSNYSKLKEDSYDQFTSDSYYLMKDFDILIDRALKTKYPLYYDLLIYKIDGKKNSEIQRLLAEKHNVYHSIEYISSLWRKKIPKIIAEQAQEDYLSWYYTTQEKGKWKTCTRCGQKKLANNRYFSKNKTSPDGWYSICKECRNKKEIPTIVIKQKKKRKESDK